MKTSLYIITKSLIHRILPSIMAFIGIGLTSVLEASAFSLDTYATNSVLAEGRWVKISVDQSGVYALTRSALRNMGFNDPQRVRIYGYGARQIADRLTIQNYVDDLPAVQSIVNAQGSVIFYAQGPDYWSNTASNKYDKILNLYSTRGYYFVTEIDAANDSLPVPQPTTAGRAGNIGEISVVTGRIHHEQSLATPGESGAELVGEDFRLTPTRKFAFNLPDRDASSPQVMVECSFVAKTFSRSSTVEVSAGSSSSTFSVGPTANDDSYYGNHTTARYGFDVSGDKIDVTLKHNSPVTVHGAWLNYLTINYQRKLVLSSDTPIAFGSNKTEHVLGGANSGTQIWDVTNPQYVVSMDCGEVVDGKIAWINSYTGHREYVIFNPDGRLPEPTIEGSVKNQNLHALQQADMVIITLPAWRSQAERIATLHREDSLDPLNVEVVDAQNIYNEFGSGAADPGAIRRFFKMLYDRSAAQSRPLRYALIMARYSYDNTGSTDAFRQLGIQIIPSWYNTGISGALNDKIGYGSDDILAMLDDGSGFDISRDKVSIAIGRMPVRSLEEATSDVDKLYDYVKNSRNTTWRNQMLFLVDDGDNGTHMKQANDMCAGINPEGAPNFVINKVFMDAYEREGSSYPQARQSMFRYLDEGSMFWVYLGHANNHQWTHDGQLTFTDINSLYLKHLPALFAGTCEFARWDSNTESGAEIMFHERYGGVIAMITATRPVYISDNGMFSAALGRALGSRDEQGRFWRMGDLYRLTKNDIREINNEPTADTNRLRYVLIGDPALRLAMPDNYVQLESINGQFLSTDDDAEQVVIPALGRPRLSGSITDPNGNILEDFNGTLQVTIFDAEKSTTSKGWGEDGAQVTFDEHGSKLYTGIISVTNGRFDHSIAMPAEIADNFRPALASFYAYDKDTQRHAAGVSSAFYVYGLDESATADTIAPVIENIYLNSEDFVSGGTVNSSPTLIVHVRDDVGINISSAGIGHQMTVQLDGNRSYNTVADYFTPASDGTPSGQVVFPIENLMNGNHTLSFRVWDTSGNSARSDIDFFVDCKSTPKLYDIYSDANPASTSANFYLTTDRPDQMVTVTVTVYNLLGHPLWTKTVRGLNDMFTTTPVNWNLCDSVGRRVSRGIYLYRATITDNGETYDTGSRRIAVTAQ